jgi:5-oxoprolinase (ATP-hydrolysing)
MEGGGPGGLGRNTWIKQLRKEDGDLPEDGSDTTARQINIGGKATLFMGKGDRLLIETPGGGAWGIPEGGLGEEEINHIHHVGAWEPRGSLAERTAAQAAF